MFVLEPSALAVLTLRSSVHFIVCIWLAYIDAVPVAGIACIAIGSPGTCSFPRVVEGAQSYLLVT